MSCDALRLTSDLQPGWGGGGHSYLERTVVLSVLLRLTPAPSTLYITSTSLSLSCSVGKMNIKNSLVRLGKVG